MDPRLTRLYQDELAHLREMGAEFAREHPKIAARLGLEGMEVADPYVERLLEGFAFLAARVQLKLEAEQPRLIAHLLESMYPNFLAPVPSMAVMRLCTDTSDPNLTRGHKVPRGSSITSLLPRGQNTLCEFRTAMTVVLWPVELSAVQYFSFAARRAWRQRWFAFAPALRRWSTLQPTGAGPPGLVHQRPRRRGLSPA
jgi:type VI secretion system protein ImpG